MYWGAASVLSICAASSTWGGKFRINFGRKVVRIVMIGAGVVGLGATMLPAGDGHRVIVLVRDPAPPPAEPAEAWQQW